jgi:hypothetical protein
MRFISRLIDQTKAWHWSLIQTSLSIVWAVASSRQMRGGCLVADAHGTRISMRARNSALRVALPCTSNSFAGANVICFTINPSAMHSVLRLCTRSTGTGDLLSIDTMTAIQRLITHCYRASILRSPLNATEASGERLCARIICKRRDMGCVHTQSRRLDTSPASPNHRRIRRILKETLNKSTNVAPL